MKGAVETARELCDGLLAIPASWLSRGRVHVLMYHRVLPDPEVGTYPLANLVIPESQFECQMAWLARHARVLPVIDALDASASSKPTVCVTFDDGYECNARVAAPILERHGIRGTFYVTTEFIAGQSLWFDAAATVFGRDSSRVSDALADHGYPADAVASLDAFLGFLKSITGDERKALLDECGAPSEVDGCSAMSPDQLRAMNDRGHEIGSHTVTHPILPREPAGSLGRELEESREQIAAWTGRRPSGLCYPNGDHSAEVREAVRGAGYRYACAIGRGSHRVGADDPFSVRRRFVTRWNSAAFGRHSDAGFAAEVLGVHDQVRRLARSLKR